ncbi:MAG: hypothetical protein U9Q35_15475, partial [Pseudomonadota bacterium]|nr:hypothetical protein [Pseudomonadota bacterium]
LARPSEEKPNGNKILRHLHRLQRVSVASSGCVLYGPHATMARPGAKKVRPLQSTLIHISSKPACETGCG